MADSLKSIVASWPRERQEQWLASLPLETLQEIDRGDWWWTSRPEQVPPPGPWSIHLYLGGRGTGKTRSGAEWLIERALRHPVDTSGFPTERLVVAPTLSDARDQCIEGASGVLRCLERRVIPYHYTKSPKPQIILRDTESRIHFVGSDPDKARGYNLADVWMDEIIKWGNAKATWLQGILPALRAKLPEDHPRAFVTTTPKPIDILFSWMERLEDPERAHTISLSTGSTYDNAENLSREALEALRDQYEGTEFGEQELHGKLLDLGGGKLFKMSDISAARVSIGPEKVVARVVGVDPSLTEDAVDGSDEMGVVVACRDERDHMYVLADESLELAGRDAALHIWRVFATYEADVVVYEDNLGKAWMRKVLEDGYYELREVGLFPPGTNPPLKPVHSNQGKVTRAEPVAMRYQQRRVHHIGDFAKLEKQMVAWDPLSSKTSPDRMDALVHACRWLMEGERKRIRAASPANRKLNAPTGMWTPDMGTFTPPIPPYRP